MSGRKTAANARMAAGAWIGCKIEHPQRGGGSAIDKGTTLRRLGTETLSAYQCESVCMFALNCFTQKTSIACVRTDYGYPSPWYDA